MDNYTDPVAALAAVTQRQAEIVAEIERLLGELKRTMPKPLTQRGTPRMKAKSKAKDKVCQTPGCGTHFTALRADARFCASCRAERKAMGPADRASHGISGPKKRDKGTTLVKGAR